jgi:hypothetical protein
VDGESAELLTGKFAKAAKLMPNLKTVFRCMLHSGQKTMENALMSDKTIQNLALLLVTNFASPKEGEHGGFSRAIPNSPRLMSMFKQADKNNMAKIAELLQMS